MNELEILFKLSNIDEPKWLQKYNLLVEAEAYYICNDQLKKLGDGINNYDYSNDLGKHIPYESGIYGYELYTTPNNAYENCPLKFINLTNQYIYTNPISDVSRTLNNFSSSYLKKIKNKINKNKAQKEIIDEYISFFQRKVNIIKEFITKIKRKYKNNLDSIPANDKNKLIEYFEYYKNYLFLINLITDKSFSFDNIKSHKACIMEATIPENNTYLNLEKTFEEQNEEIQYKLRDGYITSGYKFIKPISFNGLTGKQIYNTIKNDIIEEGYSKNPARLTSLSLNSHNIHGAFEPSIGRYIIFEPRFIQNIKIVKTFD